MPRGVYKHKPHSEKTKRKISKAHKINLIGQKFGRLTVLKDTSKQKRGYVIWLCRCDCGNFKEIQSSHLISGGSKSCGCIRKEKIKKRMRNLIRENHPNYKHGDAGKKRIRLYGIWLGMKARCLNPKTPGYHRYGGRGIKVCDEWRNSYVVFRDFALSHGYKEGLTIDRIDNDGNYEPSNVQFITRGENTRKDHY